MKAFTLIELVAVVIILAIVALIATPIVLDVIEETEKSANLSQAYLLLSGAEELYNTSQLMEENLSMFNGQNDLYDIIDMTKEKPEIGDVVITKDGKINLAVYIDGYCYRKGLDDEAITSNQEDSSECKIPVEIVEEKMSFSTWVWHLPELSADQEGYIEKLKTYNVKRVYLYLRLDITEYDYAFYQEIVKKFIDNGLEVEFLFGDPGYIKSDNLYKIDEFYNYIEGYNAITEVKYQVKTIHADVEPYALDEWDTDKAGVILLYQKYLETLNNKFSDYEINVDFPFWLDLEEDEANVKYNNEYGEGLLFEYVTTKVDGITIMSYRDTVSSIIDKIDSQVEYYNNVQVAVEYKNLFADNPDEAPKVTFYDNGLEYMFDVLNQVDELVKTQFPDRSVSYAIHELIALRP